MRIFRYYILSFIVLFFLPGCYTMVGTVSEREDSYTNNNIEEYFSEEDSDDLQYSEYEAAAAGYYDEEYEYYNETEVTQESNNSIFYTISEALSTLISSSGLDMIISFGSGSSEKSSSYDENKSTQRNNTGSRNYSGREKWKTVLRF